MAAESRPARLTIGVVGIGRVGTVLAVALAAAGHQIVAVTAVSQASRRRADAAFPGVPVLPVDEVAAAGALTLLAVPDDVLPGIVAGLAASDVWRPGQLVVHTSGASGINVLEPAEAAGALVFALHPAMTFAGRPEDAARLVGAPFGVTSRPDLRAVAETLVLEMGGEPVWVPESARPLYHAALCYGANYLVTLVNDALELLTIAGVEQAPRMLSVLTEAALDNTLRLGDAALTGPVARGDAGTVAAHMETLRTHAPQMLASYVSMGRRTTVRAADSGALDAAQVAALFETLGSDTLGHEPT
jgi:predicted short-subunit dehydrogenase-like oxidoreductase (DUF2520 family)